MSRKLDVENISRSYKSNVDAVGSFFRILHAELENYPSGLPDTVLQSVIDRHQVMQAGPVARQLCFLGGHLVGDTRKTV